jgi:hypothetical protein
MQKQSTYQIFLEKKGEKNKLAFQGNISYMRIQNKKKEITPG